MVWIVIGGDGCCGSVVFRMVCCGSGLGLVVGNLSCGFCGWVWGCLGGDGVIGVGGG